MFDWVVNTPLCCITVFYLYDNYSNHSSNTGQQNTNNDQYQR